MNGIGGGMPEGGMGGGGIADGVVAAVGGAMECGGGGGMGLGMAGTTTQSQCNKYHLHHELCMDTNDAILLLSLIHI